MHSSFVQYLRYSADSCLCTDTVMPCGAAWYFSVRPLGNSHLRSVNIGGNIAMIGGMVSDQSEPVVSLG